MPPLTFGPDKTFTIVQFTDLHIHDEEEGAEKTIALMERILDAENPDLVVLTGDTLAGEQCRDPAASLRQAVQPMEQRGLLWASVFGNHDDEGDLSRKELMTVKQSLPHCVAEPGPDSIPGVGNYVLPIRSRSTSEPAAFLYFLDSGSYGPQPIGGYAWITPEQIDWYRKTAARLGQKGPDPKPALAFFHIPLPEYDIVWQSGNAQGDKHEAVCAPRLNSGFFFNLVAVGDVLATFVGHDHINDFEGELFGIRLCYGRATGYGTYGRDDFPRGARVVRLRENRRGFDTWLRLEDGTVITRHTCSEPD